MAQIHVERTIAASPERVFGWLLDPAKLTVSPGFARPCGPRARRVPAWGAVREVTGFGLLGARTDHRLRRAPELLLCRVGAFPATRHEGGTLTCTPPPPGLPITRKVGVGVLIAAIIAGMLVLIAIINDIEDRPHDLNETNQK
jgi:hypothetical protein